MEAPKFSFVVETQETCARKDQRGPITSIIRSHLAYRQHSKRKSKSGQRLRSSSPVKCSSSSSSSRAKSCSEHTFSTSPSKSSPARATEKKEQAMPHIKLDTASLPVTGADCEGLSPFAMEYYLDEDELLQSFNPSDIDADFFPQINIESASNQVPPCYSAMGSPPATIASPGPYTPRASTDLTDLIVRGSLDTSFDSSQLASEDFDVSMQMNTACLMHDYTQIVNNQSSLVDDWTQFPCVPTQLEQPTILLQQPQNRYGGQMSNSLKKSSIQSSYNYSTNTT